MKKNRFTLRTLDDILHYPWKYNEMSSECNSTYDDIDADSFILMITGFPYHEYAMCSLFRKDENISLDEYRTVKQEKQILRMMLFLLQHIQFKHTSFRKGIRRYIEKTLSKYKSYMKKHYDISIMFMEFLEKNNITITNEEIKNTYIEYCEDIWKICNKLMSSDEFIKKYKI